MKLLAIDGNSIINRAFYGIKLLSTKDGKYTNAVYGFINILNRLLELEHPDGVAVAFDLKAPTFRHKKYDAYKAGRHAMPPELAEQFPVMKEWLTLAGYHCIECEGFEADDILGTLARSCEEQKCECVIATGDRDSLQLVSKKTRVLLAATRSGKTEITDYDIPALFERYGLTPPEMIELKALMGDSSDNIPGVAGIGEKTASDLISRFHSVDYIYDNIESIDIKESVKNKLLLGKESAYLSRWLGTICRTAPINTEIESYRCRKPEETKLASLMTSLEFFKLMEKMGLKAVRIQSDEDIPKKSVKLTVKSFSECEIKDSVDLFSGEDGFAGVSGGNLFLCDESEFSSLLENKDIKKRVYDYKNLSKKYVNAENVIFDAMLAGYLCNPSSNDYSLERLADEYGVSEPEISGESDKLLNDAALFSGVCDCLSELLQKSGQLKLLNEIEVPLARVLGEMETQGFLVDCDALKAQGEQLACRIAEIQAEIYSLAGEEFNINSPKQLGEMLFVKLKIPSKKKTKSGYSTNADVLESLKYDYPIIDLILKYRQLSKLKSTYCDGLLSCVANDGRIHSTFNQTEARTGRISSLEPNLQNIPVRTEEGKKLREYFVAKPDYVLCDADYSQIELRVLAGLSGDKTMLAAFESGTDIHTVTASEVFDIPIDMVLPVMRSRAKAVNFGIVYGIGAFSLARDIGVTRAEADRYIKNYLATYKTVAKYLDDTVSKAKLDGYVKTYFGRRRLLPELSASNGMIRAFGERVARNAPIQGTAADIIKIAMINVRNRLKAEMPDSKLILQVHDELIVECPEKDAKAVCKILEEEMENAADINVRLCVEANAGKSWLEAKG